jgi:hypothetical protein
MTINVKSKSDLRADQYSDPATNAVQPRVATVSHFERVSPVPGTEVHKCARERIKAGRPRLAVRASSPIMMSAAAGSRADLSYGRRERCGEMYRNGGR